ncbi:MAG: alpha/beta fold hydrolase [Deltaproteobacteria bacterium]|nr:MAG: alpha/beta fold hydrolase [Deltaproteobacteria bacterium]
MCWVLLILLFWMGLVASSYMIFYYESANGPHLEILRARGSLAMLLLRGFMWSLYSQLMLVLVAATALHRGVWRPARGTADRTPIVFVHGLYHNRTSWYLYLRWFRKWGWQYLKAMSVRGKFSSIRAYEKMLAAEVEQVLAETGSTAVDLVGHSMGGLVIRSYLTSNSGRAKVRRVVTLGCPHAGSKLAVFGLGRAATEMVPGSEFLENLNQTVQVPEGGNLYAVYTVLDNMIVPNESARLMGRGVTSLETRAVNHVGLLFCRHTARLVRQCLESPP